MSSTALLFLAVCWALFGTGKTALWDCRRPNVNCVGVACTGPQCADCGPGTGGYDCSATTPELNNTDPDCLCQNDGFCYEKSGAKLCSCTPEFYGDKCQFKRISLNCTWECMTALVNPIGSPVSVHVSWTDCKLAPITMGNTDVFQGAEGYYIRMCKNQTLTCADPVDDGVDRYLNVTVQYQNNVLTPADDFYRFGCIVKKVQDVEVSGGSLTVNSQVTDFEGVDANFTVGEVPIVMTVRSEATSEEVTNVKLNDEIYVELVLDASSTYNTFKLTGLTATDLSGNARISMIAGGCLNQGLRTLTKEAQKVNQRNIKVRTKAFRVSTHESVRFVATLTVCLNVLDPKCATSTCPPASRKRRDAGEESPKDDAVYTVRSGEIRITNQNRDMASEMSPLLIGVVSGTGIGVFFIILAACLVFFVLRRKQSFKPKRLSPTPSVTSSNFPSHGVPTSRA